MLESAFQSKLIKELNDMIEGCIILKNDEQYIQGIPDLLILYKKKWAMLECKKSSKSTSRPNQKFYVALLDDMSFARFIYPENKGEVLHELQKTFRPRRSTRVSEC